MYPFSLRGRKHKNTPTIMGVQYLAMASEPQESTGAGHLSFTYHNRYLAKRRVMRNVRRLRRDPLS